MQQAMLYAFLLVMPFALLSGPDNAYQQHAAILQSVMVINPLRYALDLTKAGLLEDAGFTQLLPDFFLPLAAIGLLISPAPRGCFSRRLT